MPGQTTSTVSLSCAMKAVAFEKRMLLSFTERDSNCCRARTCLNTREGMQSGFGAWDPYCVNLENESENFFLQVFTSRNVVSRGIGGGEIRINVSAILFTPKLFTALPKKRALWFATQIILNIKIGIRLQSIQYRPKLLGVIFTNQFIRFFTVDVF